MEKFKKRFDAVLLILSVEGFAQYNVMRVKWNLPIKQPWYMSEGTYHCCFPDLSEYAGDRCADGKMITQMLT